MPEVICSPKQYIKAGIPWEASTLQCRKGENRKAKRSKDPHPYLPLVPPHCLPHTQLCDSPKGYILEKKKSQCIPQILGEMTVTVNMKQAPHLSCLIIPLLVCTRPHPICHLPLLVKSCDLHVVV